MNDLAGVKDRFVETLEHRRFTEFCDACRDFHYIGLCHGPPGVGKTLSARRYAQADKTDGSTPAQAMPDGKLEVLQQLDTVLFTVPVTNTPRMIESGILAGRQLLLNILLEPVLRAEEAVRREERQRWLDHRALLRLHDWSAGPPPGPASFAAGEELLRECQERRRLISDPTRLVIVDEADWLRLDSLEAARAVFDQGGIGLVLIGMPGMEKRLARYPQLYSRIGFVHSFRTLEAPEIRRLLREGWSPPGTGRLGFEEEAVAAVIRITGGNFRLLNRLLSQTGRVVRLNHLSSVTPDAVHAARENLTLGPE